VCVCVCVFWGEGGRGVDRPVAAFSKGTLDYAGFGESLTAIRDTL
jgi:hypothetical protein